MKYYVIENRNVGLHGAPSFVKTVLFSGTEKECTEFEAEKKETIAVNGKTYFKKAYEYHNK